ncbi:MAG: hypothetical protein QNK15_08720 [Cycloclasticus sp.]|nr:hypothetical protein [Cycloclasticus sp.]
MSANILKPVFSENQILKAIDINSIVSHSQGADVRHNQYLHQWGIAHGLNLQQEEREDTSGTFAEITLSPGIAIDGLGREIVVTEQTRLSENVFDQLNLQSSTGSIETNFYPVFLQGRDSIEDGGFPVASACESAGPNRVLEGFEITFGRIGDAAELVEQLEPALGDLAGLSEVRNWRILLGFVTWDGVHFTSAVDTAEGVERRYVGVKAADVAGMGNSLTLRSADRRESDHAALVIDDENGGEMRFGLQDISGKVVPVLTVNAQGDLKAEGRILGAIAGGVQVETGVITDGLDVPLPAGINQDMLDSADATIQVQLQPRYQQPASLPPLPANEFWIMQPLECYADGRRVKCLVRWEETSGVLPPMVVPGVCDYIVMGFVKSENGGG